MMSVNVNLNILHFLTYLHPMANSVDPGKVAHYMFWINLQFLQFSYNCFLHVLLDMMEIC